jgi:hypothetical protein
MLKNRTTTTHLHKVRAHINIIGNEEADKLAKDGSKIVLVSDIPFTHMKAPTPHHIGGAETMTTHLEAQYDT